MGEIKGCPAPKRVLSQAALLHPVTSLGALRCWSADEAKMAAGAAEDGYAEVHHC